MATENLYYGCVFASGRCVSREVLHGAPGIIAFLKIHLFDHAEIRIMGPHPQRMIFQAIDSVDLFSELQIHGVDLPRIYEEIKHEALMQGIDPTEPREPWEDDYDSWALSPDEILMRQRVKRAAKATTTVADVIALLEGTYFNAVFHTEDGQRSWGYFDSTTVSATPLAKNDDDGWIAESDKKVRLSPNARVKYIRSGEDIHMFTILDPPESEP